MRQSRVIARVRLLAGVAACVIAGTAGIAQACTRILWNTNGFAVMMARTMDWPESTHPILRCFPAA